jgi:hypothetical protein
MQDQINLSLVERGLRTGCTVNSLVFISNFPTLKFIDISYVKNNNCPCDFCKSKEKYLVVNKDREIKDKLTDKELSFLLGYHDRGEDLIKEDMYEKRVFYNDQFIFSYRYDSSCVLLNEELYKLKEIRTEVYEITYIIHLIDNKNILLKKKEIILFILNTLSLYKIEEYVYQNFINLINNNFYTFLIPLFTFFIQHCSACVLYKRDENLFLLDKVENVTYDNEDLLLLQLKTFL